MSLPFPQWFGQVVYAFRGFGESFVSLLWLCRGTTVPTLTQMYSVNPHLASFLLFLVTATTAVILPALLLSVLRSVYHHSRAQTRYCNTHDMQDYELVDLMMKRFKRILGITKEKPVSMK